MLLYGVAIEVTGVDRQPRLLRLLRLLRVHACSVARAAEVIRYPIHFYLSSFDKVRQFTIVFLLLPIVFQVLMLKIE
jgi:hypothetical protein